MVPVTAVVTDPPGSSSTTGTSASDHAAIDPDDTIRPRPGKNTPGAEATLRIVTLNTTSSPGHAASGSATTVTSKSSAFAGTTMVLTPPTSDVTTGPGRRQIDDGATEPPVATGTRSDMAGPDVVGPNVVGSDDVVVLQAATDATTSSTATSTLDPTTDRLCTTRLSHGSGARRGRPPGAQRLWW